MDFFNTALLGNLFFLNTYIWMKIEPLWQKHILSPIQVSKMIIKNNKKAIKKMIIKDNKNAQGLNFCI